MSDILNGFFTGMEEFAKTMREHALVAEQNSSGVEKMLIKVEHLTERVEKLLGLLEEKLGTAIEFTPARGKRMMDIKQRIIENVASHPEGIRPPQIALKLGTKVQNLYPHLKSAVNSRRLIKDGTGSYFLSRDTVEKTRKPT